MSQEIKFEPTVPRCPRKRHTTCRCGQRGFCATCKDYGGVFIFDNTKILCHFKPKRKERTQ